MAGLLKLAGEVEANLGEIGLRHLQDVVGVGKKYVAAFAVGGHELVFAFLERFECCLIVTFKPAGLVKRNRLPTYGGPIFM